MERNEEGLQSLGSATQYRMDYAPEVLETFMNKHPENDYWVRFNCPEFTSLCPITGQPDLLRYVSHTSLASEWLRVRVLNSIFLASVIMVISMKTV